MKNIPANLVCTVGTSLFIPNLNRLDPGTCYQSPPRDDDPQGQADWEALSRKGLDDLARLKSLLVEIKSAHEDRDYSRVAALFTQLPPELRLLGAEINSIEAMVRKRFLPEDRARLILLVSETRDGEAIGQILCSYFQHPACPIGFTQCDVATVEGLQDEKPLIFQRNGLTNLVRLLGDHYRKWGGAIAVNATGGYKAQIALAVAFGQATGSPVYYKHERFDQIIRFPKVPFTLDLSLIQNHLKLWADLAEPEASFDEADIQRRLSGNQELQEAIDPLLDWIDGNGSRLFELSALGRVYWEAFRSLNPEVRLEPASVNERKGCHFPDHHYPIGFNAYVDRFYNAFPEFVRECHALPYDGQRGIQNRFYRKENRIIGEYVDRTQFGARFEVMTSAENELERDFLIERFTHWITGP